MWLAGRALYWADARNNDIGMYHLDTRQQRILLREPSAHYFGLFVMGDYLYVTDWKRRYVLGAGGTGFECVQRSFIDSFSFLFFSFFSLKNPFCLFLFCLFCLFVVFVCLFLSFFSSFYFT